MNPAVFGAYGLLLMEIFGIISRDYTLAIISWSMLSVSVVGFGWIDRS